MPSSCAGDSGGTPVTEEAATLSNLESPAGAPSAPKAQAPNAMRQQLSRAVAEFSSHIAEAGGGGALVQVWMPEVTSDGTVVLSAQGLPFAVVGVGDLLALFRCVSVRYRFSTDLEKPSLMGCIGRVFCTLEPEMSRDVQKYDRNVYLRVSEAQRCRVHSTLVVPVFHATDTQRPAAILELVQNDKECPFTAVMSALDRCLQAVQLRTCSLDTILRDLPGWMQQTSGSRQEGQGDAEPVAGPSIKARISTTGTASAVPAALPPVPAALTVLAEDGGENNVDGCSPNTSVHGVTRMQQQPRHVPASPGAADALRDLSSGLQALAGQPDHDVALATHLSGGNVAVQLAPPAHVNTMQQSQSPQQQQLGASVQVGLAHLPQQQVLQQQVQQGGSYQAAAVDVKPPPQPTQTKQRSKGNGALSRQLASGANTAPAALSGATTAAAGAPAAIPHAVLSWMTSNGIGPEALDALKAMLSKGNGAAEEQGPKLKQQRQSHNNDTAYRGQAFAKSAAGALPLHTVSEAVPVQQKGQDLGRQAKRQHWSQVSPPNEGLGLLGRSEGAGGLPLASPPQQLQQYMQPQYQSEPGGTMQRMLAGDAGTGIEGEGEAEGEAEGGDDDGDVGSSSGGEDDAEEGVGTGAGASGRPVRIGIGAGRRLRYEELQSQFGKGLKEAAANLGICATTLKRACRRHGIKRWPRRQIQKLNRTLTAMGFQGAPPALLVQSAVKGQLGGAAEAAAPPARAPGLKRQASSKVLAQQQQQQQQMAAALRLGSLPMPLHEMLVPMHEQLGMDARHASMPHAHASLSSTMQQFPPATASYPAGSFPDMTVHGAVPVGWQPHHPTPAQHSYARILSGPDVSMGQLDSSLAAQTCDDVLLWGRTGGSIGLPNPASPSNLHGLLHYDLHQATVLPASQQLPQQFEPQPSCSGTSMGLIHDLLGRQEPAISGM